MRIDSLRDTHPKIYLRILECQSIQGNNPNDALELHHDVKQGNFNWAFTEEGEDVWEDVYKEKFESWYRHHKLEYSKFIEPTRVEHDNKLDYLSAILRTTSIITIFTFDYAILSIVLFGIGEILALINKNK